MRIRAFHTRYGRSLNRRRTLRNRRRLLRLFLITIGMCLLLGPKVVGQSQPCSATGGLRDTHVRAWFPVESYDDEPRMWIRTGADFAFLSLDEPASKIEFSFVSRTSANPITVVAHRLKGPWPSNMTFSIWSEIRDDFLGGMLDQVLVDGLGRYSLKTYGAQYIMLEARGPSVGYAIMSSDGWEGKPTWCKEPVTPTPPPSPTPRATPTQVSPINRIEVPSDVLPIILQYAIISDAYAPGTCFELAANQDGNGRSVAPDFLIVLHMPGGEVLRWKFQRFENGSVYIAPADRPCDVGVEYLR